MNITNIAECHKLKKLFSDEKKLKQDELLAEKFERFVLYLIGPTLLMIIINIFIYLEKTLAAL